MRYGINVEHLKSISDGRVLVTVSDVKDSLRYKDYFPQRKRVEDIEYLKYLEFDLDTDDAQVATHFVLKTLEVNGEIYSDKPGISISYLNGNRLILNYSEKNKDKILHAVDFCDPYYVLIFDDVPTRGRKYTQYFEKVLKCDTDVVFNLKELRDVVANRIYDLVLFFERSDLIWRTVMNEVRSQTERTNFAVVNNNDTTLQIAELEGLPAFETTELVDLEKELIPKRYKRAQQLS